jgi:2-polyprenyl-6-methoxyphenol hydroxylase-like FAD-dependent oxidoreductase
MTKTSAANCQVLIIGAGPTGLVLAAQLLARGISTRVIDKAVAPFGQSRALGIHARTLELLDTMNLADSFIARGHKVRRMRMYAGQKNLVDLGLGRNGSRFNFTLHLPQWETETLLRDRVRELGGVIERGVELVRLAQNGVTVDVTLRDAAGREVGISSDYVVGCDGAHSRVRHELRLPFDGQPYAHDWLLADVALDGAGSEDAVHLFFRADGLPLTCIPLGGHRWRVVMPNAGDRAAAPPTFEEIQDIVARRAPWPISISDPTWLSCFRCHLRVTTSYRRGRVLLAGDAAHVHSPAGGQGMNTGMLDAGNLAWKLALVADRCAPERLLDSYGQERLPVASGVLAFTDRMVALMTVRHPVKRAMRNALLPAAAALPVVQQRIAGRLSQTSIAYAPGPLVRPDDIRRGPKPGQRCADVDVRTDSGPARLHRLLGHGRHVLIVSTDNARGTLDSSGLRRFAGLVDLVDGNLRPAFVLVRPDGVVAIRGSHHEARRLVAYLRQVFGDGGGGSAPVLPGVRGEVARIPDQLSAPAAR